MERFICGLVLAVSLAAGAALGIRPGVTQKNGSKAETGWHQRLTTVRLFWIYAAMVIGVSGSWLVFRFLEAGPQERASLLKVAGAFALLFLSMVSGMLASIILGQLRAGEDTVPPTRLLLPLTCSVLVFGSFWAGFTPGHAGAMEIFAAFESGFAWESFLNRLGLPKAPGETKKVGSITRSS